MQKRKKTSIKKQVDREAMHKARRQLVVLLSGMFAFFLGFYPAVIIVTKAVHLLNFGPSLEGVEVPISMAVILIAFIGTLLVVGLITSIIWKFAISFYLSIEEWQELDKVPYPYIPIIAPIFNKSSALFLKWKIDRENRKPNL